MENPILKGYEDDNVRTAFDAFFQGLNLANRVGDSRFLGYRSEKSSNPYEWITYDQVSSQALNIASGLIHLGLKPGPETLIGIYSINCPQWMISSIACFFQSWIIVPLYHTVSDSCLIHIVGQCELHTCFVRSQKDIDRMLKLIPGCPGLAQLISFETPTNDQILRATESNVKLLSLTDLQNIGSKVIQPYRPPLPSDIVNICYTSGTTGAPKGAMISHANIISIVCSQSVILKTIEDEGKEFILSYLPLAHALGFGIECTCMYNGYKIGYFNGDVKKIFEDMKELKPTLLPTVPRLLDRVYGEIHKKIDRKKIGVFKSVLFKLTYSLKRRSLCNGNYRKQHLADRVVFGPIQSMFGGRLKLVLVGSSPSNPDVLGFMKVVLGCIVIEGYGQTECSGASHTQPLYDMTVGNVGKSIQCCETKIIDVPELKYFARNNSGELCIKGYNVFRGYYKCPDKTKEVIDDEGWLHTGDIVMVAKNGNVSIVDRKNEIFKLSQGEYVVPSKIEQIYHKMNLVSQCFVYGSPYKSYTIAVIVPDEECFLELAQKNDIAGNFEDLCKDAKMIKLLQKAIDQASTSAQLTGVEKVRKIIISSESFTIENGLLTPTLKLRRGVCASHYRSEIDALYKNFE